MVSKFIAIALAAGFYLGIATQASAIMLPPMWIWCMYNPDESECRCGSSPFAPPLPFCQIGVAY